MFRTVLPPKNGIKRLARFVVLVASLRAIIFHYDVHMNCGVSCYLDMSKLYCLLLTGKLIRCRHELITTNVIIQVNWEIPVGDYIVYSVYTAKLVKVVISDM